MTESILSNESQSSSISSHEDQQTLIESFLELQSFDSIFQALRWKHVKRRFPSCFYQTIRDRYFWANIVYLLYCFGILIIDFSPNLNSTNDGNTNGSTTTFINDYSSTEIILNSTIDQPTFISHMYIGFGVVHLLSAALYVWSWVGRAWSDIIMIPEYLNHVEASLYIWSASWYLREDTYGGYYTLAVHRIEMAAATIELVASVGWIISWYLTYTRTLGHGFTLDDPDMFAILTTTTASIMYFVYNIQINLQPALYATNYLYKYADILYFIGACYYLFGSLRDDNWFWFLPFCGQYGIAPGKVRVESTHEFPIYGKLPIELNDLCRRRKIVQTQVRYQTCDDNIAVISNQ